MPLSRDQRRQLLVEAEAARGEQCFGVADRLDAAGLRPGAYDLGDNRVRLKLSVDALCDNAWWSTAAELPAPAPDPDRGPLFVDARAPIFEAWDAEQRQGPDAAFRTRA